MRTTLTLDDDFFNRALNLQSLAQLDQLLCHPLIVRELACAPAVH